ncbi:serine hydrolase domain-containing protein [Longispora albida]|uniref:serine hydrolase domain-containing protein n=1 Tax=Longispora albida TaxID=203523 RepID=UPI0012F9D1C4|nr:serine hydrolase domain-containing protein [Longispora albida]
MGIPAPAMAADRVTLGDVQRAIANLAKIEGVVGAIGEVYVDGKRAGHGSAGSRLLGGQGGRIPSGSRYRIASQTKIMEATVILQLVSEGRLGLDDRLSDLLPEVAKHDWVDRSSEITVRMLLRHSSGIPQYTDSGLFDTFDFTTSYAPVDLVKASRTVPREGEPGQGYRYSTTNYVLLGMIIERVTGNDRAEEFERRIFAPLGMDRSYLVTRVSDLIRGPHGHGYFPDPASGGRPRDVDRLNGTVSTEAAISTARDVSAFFRAFTQGKLLSPELQRQVPKPFPTLCGGTVAGVGGSAPGINSVTFTSADGRVQFAVATTLSIDNMQTRPLSEATEKAAESVLCPGKSK